MAAKILLALLPLAAALSLADWGLEPNPQNVVASRLEGAWVPEPVLSARLWPAGARARERFEFRADPAVAEQVPERMRAMLDGHPAYMAGRMLRNGFEHPFVLLNLHGNPHVLWFREDDGDPFGDSESFNVMLVRAEQREADLLFIGGDFNNQPFLAYQRAERPGAVPAEDGDPRRAFIGHWETADRVDRFSIRFEEGGSVVPFHDGSVPATEETGAWTLLDDGTIEVELAGATSTARLDEYGRLLWTPPAAVGHGQTLVLTPRHQH